MRHISVLTENPYQVIIGDGLLDKLPNQLKPMKNRKLFLLTDRTVWALYGKKLQDALKDFSCTVHVTETGEQAKSLASYGRVLEAMAAAGLHRNDLLLALGGGVVGDLGGFAAASYLRGIDFIQIPTTLLAAVDSSVGGKTAINLENGKNLAGAFHQPAAVYLDPAVFQTLPDAQWTNGAAEMIKTGVLFDAALFTRLAEGIRKDDADLTDLLSACIRHKAAVVLEDEKDHGRRQLLNFGHTIGHAIEACSGFSLLHGHAVAAGMAMIARACEKRGICRAGTAELIEAALAVNGLPVRTDFTQEQLMPFIQRDKKARGDFLQLVVPEEIGAARLEKVLLEEIPGWLEDAND